MKRPYLLKKRGQYWYYRLAEETTFHSTGIKTKNRAELFVVESIKEKKTEGALAEGLTLREYADRYFIWETCPHVGRLVSERKSITRRHVKEQRALLDRNVFTDALANMKISKIRRADILDFRTRLLKRTGDKIRTVNKTIGVLKTIFKEGIFREDLERNPVVGIGDINYKQREIGIFTIEELRNLFPSDSLGPWKDIQDHTCFLLAAVTGMRKAEILALRWENINFEKRFIRIDTAWKSREELGLPKWDRVRNTPILLFEDIVISRLIDLQEQSIRIAPDDLIFCYDDGSRLGDTWWKKRFSAALEKVGIDRKARNLMPHSFRHTLNTILIDAGKDPAKVRSVLGWRHEKTQDNYTHFDIEHFKDLRID